MALQDLLSTADLADLLGLEEQTLRKRRHDGLPMPPGRRLGHAWVYCRTDVETWLAQQNRDGEERNGQHQGRP